MLRVDYLINKMLENIDAATMELESKALEQEKDLLKKK